MKTVTINLYSFDELSKEAQSKAIEKLFDINVDYEWWEWTFEDAVNIGIKLESFDIDRGNYCKGKLTISAPECAEKIISEHGKDCETYKTAKQFLSGLEALTGQYEDIEDCPEDEIESLEDDFLQSILEDYRIILSKEYEYKTSKEAIIETIKANEYTFESDGTLNNG